MCRARLLNVQTVNMFFSGSGLTRKNQFIWSLERDHYMENKSLVSIVAETVSIEKMLIESGGEVTPEMEAFLAVNAQELAEKVDGYDMIITRFKNLAEFYNQKAEFYLKISAQCVNTSEKLKKNIKLAMETLKVDEVKGNEVRFTLVKGQGSLKIKDPEMVPVEFKQEIIETVIDNARLKAACKLGPVPGAEIEYNPSLRTFANLPDKKTKAVKNV